MAETTVTKVTKRDHYAMVRAIIEESAVVNKDELLAFVDHEVELLAKKSSSKGNSEAQKANTELKQTILETLRANGKPMKCGELVTILGQSQSKISAMLSQLGPKGTGEVVRTQEKKDVYFSVAD